MLGQITWCDKKRIGQRRTVFCGMPLFSVELPLKARRKELLVRKAVRLLLGQKVTRVLVPREWEFWPELQGCGLHPVNTTALRCALAPRWVFQSLRVRGIAPEQAAVLLSGRRESTRMAEVARLLCPLVRNLVIDVPAGGELAAELHREFGLPVLPERGTSAHLTLRFYEGPILEGAVFALSGGRVIPREVDALSLLAVLWENQRIKTEDIVLLI